MSLPMRLWLVCCVLLFMAVQGYDWLLQRLWLPGESLSLAGTVLAGIALAIASNRDSLKAFFAPRASPPPPLPNPPTETPAAPVLPAPPAAPTAAAQSPARKSASISFEILKKRSQESGV